ncbi:hypothetical protein GLAREA_01743 [Glarea lozoyensis ATCC 20868]|uniref:N-acetyltransferase domain-containing protein n=1 Tax=Glarea lozoyensis (strain ATCC 20868 / MF5171) TaxID=1116229 RepID=S3D1E3_GLAL2|nr:uncharacterized protein GLAREA_01743 [Glarea lozoyensis ATCC 20868]EPE25831.1 hypothetical protein GLAREA_01743 [Glarea lozoyensis ATCC 20868]
MTPTTSHPDLNPLKTSQSQSSRQPTIHHALVPPSDVSELILTHPADQELQHIYNLTHSSWGDALKLPEYLEESTHLANAPLAKNGGLDVWILTSAESHPNERPILSACETFLKRAFVTTSAHNGVNTVEEKIVYGIASVFTNPVYRGNRYAARMLIKLSDVLKKKEDCVGSMLYSDIGPDYYAKLGWTPTERNSQVEFHPKAYDNLPNVEILTANGLEELCRLDERMLYTILEKEKEVKRKMVVVPDLPHMQWHHAKEGFVCQKLFGKIPELKGASIGAPGQKVWIIWTHRYYSDPTKLPNDNTLYILRLALEDLNSESNGPHLKVLMETAQNEAKAWNLGKVVMWNPKPEILKLIEKSEVKCKVVEKRGDAIASLKWHEQEKIEWVENEMYAWC